MVAQTDPAGAVDSAAGILHCLNPFGFLVPTGAKQRYDPDEAQGREQGEEGRLSAQHGWLVLPRASISTAKQRSKY